MNRWERFTPETLDRKQPGIESRLDVDDGAIINSIHNDVIGRGKLFLAPRPLAYLCLH